MKSRPVKREWGDALTKCHEEGRCRVCGSPDIQVALDGLKRVAYPDDSSKWVRGCEAVATEDDGPIRAEFRISWEAEDAA